MPKNKKHWVGGGFDVVPMSVKNTHIPNVITFCNDCKCNAFAMRWSLFLYKELSVEFTCMVAEIGMRERKVPFLLPSLSFHSLSRVPIFLGSNSVPPSARCALFHLLDFLPSRCQTRPGRMALLYQISGHSLLSFIGPF